MSRLYRASAARGFSLAFPQSWGFRAGIELAARFREPTTISGLLLLKRNEEDEEVVRRLRAYPNTPDRVRCVSLARYQGAKSKA